MLRNCYENRDALSTADFTFHPPCICIIWKHKVHNGQCVICRNKTVHLCVQGKLARGKPPWLPSYKELKSIWKGEVSNTSTSVSMTTTLMVSHPFWISTSQDILLSFDSFWPFPFWRLCLDHTRCNAWVLDGDFYHKGLQGVAVPVDAIGNTLLLITVDMSRPWNALDSLQKWAMVAREHVDKLRVPPETLRELEHRRESSSENTSFVLPVLVCFFFFSSTLLLTQSRSDATAHLRPQWGQAV